MMEARRRTRLNNNDFYRFAIAPKGFFDYETLFTYYNMTEEQIEELIPKNDLSAFKVVSATQKLSRKFIDKHWEKLNKEYLLENKRLKNDVKNYITKRMAQELKK